MAHSKLNVALLGCGRMGEVHGEAYAAMQDVARVFYVSLDPEDARIYAARFGGAGIFATWEDAVESEEIDAIDNCLPDDLHVSVSQAALENGKHVLVEKPIAHSLDGALRLVRAGKRANRSLMLAENFRFLPHVGQAQALIAEGALGDVFLIEVNYFERLQPSGWRTARRSGAVGGMLIDVGHHFIDMAVQLGGEIDWVFAQFAQATLPQFTGEDTATLAFRYRSGVIGQLTASIGASGAPPKPTFHICGTRASLYFDWQSGLWMGSGRAWTPATLMLAKDPEPPDSFDYWAASIHACVRAFVSEVRAGLPASVPGEVGLHDLAIILAAHESARTQQMIPVRDEVGVR